LDQATVRVIGRMPPALADFQKSPSARQAREQAAAERWRSFFSRLLVDADASLDKPAAKSMRRAARWPGRTGTVVGARLNLFW
jgi:hypothetical protein